MKLFLFSSDAAATTTSPLLLLLLLSLSTFVVEVVDAQGGRPDWAGQGGNKGNKGSNGNGNGQGQGRPNGGGGQGQGGLFKGFGNKNNKNNNGNKFGFKNIGKLLDDFGEKTCEQLQIEYEKLNPETTDLFRREANKKRKGIRTLLCLKECTASSIAIPEVECVDNFTDNLCTRMIMQEEKALKKATKFQSRAAKGNVPERIQQRFANKADRMMEMKEQLSEQLGQLQTAGFCVATPAGN